MCTCDRPRSDHLQRLKEKSRSVTRPHGSGVCCHDSGTRESLWESLCVLWNVAGIWTEELAQRLRQLETQVGQQRAVIEHQQERLMRQQTTIDAERAARTAVVPIAQDARVNLVDLRVGNKPETFGGETHTSGKVGHSRCDNTSRRWMKNFTWNS